MSNRATIEPTEFTNIRTGMKSHGVRVYDDYGQTYDNTWAFIPDDDMEILEKVKNSDDEIVVAIIDHLVEMQKGITIGDNWYEWDDIKHLFDEE